MSVATSRRRRTAAGLLVVAALGVGLHPIAASAAPAVVNVPAEVATIQGAIDIVGDGGTVVVAAGVYHENLVFHGTRAEVRSADGPGTTIIDGGGIKAVAMFSGSETPETILRGFTLRNGTHGVHIIGSSPTIIGNVIAGNGNRDPNYNGTKEGAGLLVWSSQSTIRDNVIRGNRALRAAGLSLNAADGALIVGNTIENNEALFTAGMQIGGGAPVVLDNLFRGNHAVGSAGAIEAFGEGRFRIAQNVFVDNHSGGYGGAVQHAGTGGELISNTFLDNHAPAGTAISGSGSMFIANNVITGPATGPAVYCESGRSGRYFFNDVYNGTATPFKFCPQTIDIVGNISSDPQLRADFSLAPGSPAIDAGFDDPIARRLEATDGNGAPRVTDGNADGAAAVDMGAFESPGRGWTPEAAVSPAAVDFGIIPVGTSATRSVSVTGTGRWTAHPGIPTVTGMAAAAIAVAGGTCTGAILAATESCSVTVTYTPTAVGALAATLTIPSDAGTFTVPVTGRAADLQREAYVDHVTRELFGRPPTPAETAAWSPSVGSARGRVELTVALVGTREFRVQRVAADAQAWLGHPPDPSPAAALVDAMGQGAIVEIAPALFAGSDELYASSGGTPEGFVDALFRATLGVTPDAAGRSALAGVLRTGYSRTSLAVLLLTHPAARARLVDAAYQRHLGHPPDAALRSFWVDTITRGTRSEYLVAYLLSTEEYWSDASL